MTDCLQVISSGLLVSDMGIDGGVSCSSSQVLAVSERNVLTIRALVALGQSKIDNEDSVLGLLGATNQKVVGFDISMDDSFFMDSLDSLDHLDCNVETSLQIKLSPAFLELVLKTLSKEIHDHDMVHLAILCLLITHKMQVRNGSLASQLVDQF